MNTTFNALGMEDFFERIHNLNTEVDLGYIGSEVNRLRAYLYTLRAEDRQREVERLQTDLTYWHLVMSYKEVNFDYGLFEYALYLLADLKKGFGLDDTEELSKLLDLAQEFNFVECGRTIADLPNKDKVCEILYIIERADKVRFSAYRDFALIGVEPSNKTEDEEPENTPQPREIPKELQEPGVMDYLQEARKRGLIDDNYQWQGIKADCALFCACVNIACDLHHKNTIDDPKKPTKQKHPHLWKPWEKLLYGNDLPQGGDLSSNFRSLKNYRSDKRLEGKNYKKIAEIFPFDIESVLD